MKILAFESSAKAASVALGEDGKLISQYTQASGLTHSRTLLKMAEDLLENAGTKLENIDVLAVAQGPGSFTGVRIGVAAVKGLAWGADKPAVGVSTLEAMAYHLIDRTDGVICCSMDARRGEMYNAKFLSDGEKLTRLCPDRAVPLKTVMEEAEKEKKRYFFVGDGAELCYNAFLEAGLEAQLPAEPMRLQSAWGVMRAAAGREAADAAELTPEYLRLSQAERERLEKENKIKGEQK